MIRITLSPNQRRQLEQGRRYQPQIAERCHYVLLNLSRPDALGSKPTSVRGLRDSPLRRDPVDLH